MYTQIWPQDQGYEHLGSDSSRNPKPIYIYVTEISRALVVPDLWIVFQDYLS